MCVGGGGEAEHPVIQDVQWRDFHLHGVEDV